eukprot:CAMPEP_0172535110 /NCGR_PEP_ID=MMETSP1067-20121228/7250_1 /TAXON_ID=265564 ORGANISM="Thalassiosira punctigera, Strain Tpunct2005C2" /NCGR_SAMPLE_ID=MMETSP1067 /ASSEMBLY_ACC=CAM_ASM_000444 /LENGTH=310 /DNA_ID=CAMNT_0013320005 /DNA_START=187 /DNA_END=1120 /DNA_ORIENTATION=+
MPPPIDVPPSSSDSCVSEIALVDGQVPPYDDERVAVVARNGGAPAAAAREPINRGLNRNRNILPLDLIESSRVKLALPVIGNAAYVALASGFLTTDMLTLRLALVGGYSGLVAFHSLHPRPLRIPLKWSALFVLVNAGAACLLIADQWGGSLSDDESRLHEEHFSMLTRGQFKQLMSIGTARVLPAGSRLTEEGVHSEVIYFTRRGCSRLYLRGKYAKDIEEGSFVNDVAFQQGDRLGAYGTVIAEGDVEVMEWRWRDLREHLEGRPDMDRNMRLCLTSSLVKGLLQQRKAAYSDSNEALSIQDLPDMVV